MTEPLDADFTQLLSNKSISHALVTIASDETEGQAQQSSALLGYLLAIRTAQSQVIHDELTEARNLARHMGHVLEEERTRIARDLHDQLGQALTEMKFDLAMINERLSVDPVDRQHVLEKTLVLTELADEMIKVVRQIAWNLRPSILDDFGLLAALEWQAESFQKRTGVHCDVTARGDVIQLNREATTSVFRMIQETLTNVARHAHATEVLITAGMSDGQFVFEVRDNGRGIRMSDQRERKTLGLLGLRERARLLGGRADIAGVAGKGTTVTIHIPIDINRDSNQQA